MVKRGVLLALLALALYGALGWPQRREDNTVGKSASLQTTVAALEADDPEARESAKDAILRLGPGRIEELRRVDNQFVERVVAMHDWLVAEPDEQADSSAVAERAREAIEFFASRAAAGYIAVGLRSPLLEVRAQTARALHQLPPGATTDNPAAVVAIVVHYLDSQPPLRGSEYVSISSGINETLMGVLLEATNAGVDEKMTDYMVAYGKEWLKEHGGSGSPEAADRGGE